MKNKLFIFALMMVMLISCNRTRTTTTTTDPTTGQTTTTTEEVIPANDQPPFMGTTDYYGNSDFGYGGFWDVYGRYRFFTDLTYGYGYGRSMYHYNPYLYSSIHIYQPSIRTYGYARSSTITYNGRSVNRGNAVASIPQQRVSVNNNAGNINRGNGGTMRANGGITAGSSMRNTSPSPRMSTPMRSSSPMRASGGISSGGRRK